MKSVDHHCLRNCLEQFAPPEALPPSSACAVVDELAPANSANLTEWVGLYEETLHHLEQAMWQPDAPRGDFNRLLTQYQALFRELNALIEQHDPDSQSRFLICIPVADRPAHLRECLESIYQNALLFGYGGFDGKLFRRFTVIIAEDSRDPEHIAQHIALAQEYSAKGLDTRHYGFEEQLKLLNALPDEQREALGHVLTTQSAERFYLKGQAANRNLGYLKFLDITDDREHTLYYLVDSDQYFKVPHPETGQAVFALNYFYYVNRAFQHHDLRMLTGKLVGDPPVSPSVMAVNFVRDVQAFFSRLRDLEPTADCSFHPDNAATVSDAAYHDMADFFGFKQQQAHYDYPCHLRAEHNHLACLEGLCKRLNAFFFGEHLTRKTSFVFGDGFTSLSPARTIYPGNYVVDFAGLKYIIPFGHLRLRMSGPTAGRLVQAEIGEQFAAINLPMLHGRTTDDETLSDFRPGVEQVQARIDLSDEFERQFFGDLMLFSVVEIFKQRDASSGFNGQFDPELISAAFATTETTLLKTYANKHQAIQQAIADLQAVVFTGQPWWLEHPQLGDALAQVRDFIGNIQRNFAAESPAWALIQSQTHRAQRTQAMQDALLNYHRERQHWDQLFSAQAQAQTQANSSK